MSLIGLAFVASIDFWPGKPLAYLAAAVTLTGILMTGVGVQKGRSEMREHSRKVDREAAERRAARRKALDSK